MDDTAIRQEAHRLLELHTPVLIDAARRRNPNADPADIIARIETAIGQDPQRAIDQIRSVLPDASSGPAAEDDEQRAVIDRLIEIGGKEWRRGDRHRVYFGEDSMCAFAGLSVIRAGTGNISKAWKDGDSVSNSHARGIIGGLPQHLYYDVGAGKFRWRAGDEPTVRDIIRKIREKMSERQAG